MKSIRSILLAAALAAIPGCQKGPIFSPREGLPHLELTGVQADGPATLRLLFSEPLSETGNGAGAFFVANASTAALVPVASVSIAQQAATLSLGPATTSTPYLLVAGHVYDVQYRAVAEENGAVAEGVSRFRADFWPAGAPAPSVFSDSGGNLMLIWTPDNRVGNTSLEVWRKAAGDNEKKAEHLASLPPAASLFWGTARQGAADQFALKVKNAYGESDFGAWTAAEPAAVAVFLCKNECITTHLSPLTQALPAAGYVEIPVISDCSRREWENRSTGERVVFQYHPEGVEKLTIGAGGVASVDTLFQPCR